MSKFSPFGGFSLSSPSKGSASTRDQMGDKDETGSMVSDMSYTNEGSWMKRFLGGDDLSIDDVLRDLYGDTDTLEERCKFSTTTIESIANDSARRRSMAESMGVQRPNKKTQEEIIASLNDGYFTPDFDPVAMHLEKVQQWAEIDMSENFMHAIEETDTNKDVVVSKLSVMIESNYNELMNCMRDVHAIDIDLARAGIQVTNGRRKLNTADRLIVSGTLKIQELHLMKQRLVEVEKISGAVLKLKKSFKEVHSLMNAGDLGKSALCAYDLLISLQDEVYEHIFSVAHLGESVQNLIPAIRFKTDHALFKNCSRNFTTEKYADIISSYLMLDVMQETMGVQVVDASTAHSGGIFQQEKGSCTDGLAERIVRFMTVDVENCVREAIVEFLPEARRLHWGQFAGRMDESNAPLAAMIEDVTGDLYAVQSVVRTCEFLAAVIHTHYLITQWHRLPFDERSKDPAFLHRCPNELFTDGLSDNEADSDSEDEKDRSHEEGDEGAGSNKKSNKKKNSRLANFVESGIPTEDVGERLRKARLSLASQNLARSRPRIWAKVESAVVLVLNSVHPTSAVSVEDFLSMIWSLQSLMRIGQEFCGLQSNRILSTMREKCVEYFSEIHSDSYEHMRAMIENETWSSVPVRVSDMGGIIGIIKSNVRKRDTMKAAAEKSRIRLQGMIRETEELRRKKTAALAAKYASDKKTPEDGGSVAHDSEEIEVTQLMSFHKHGNPLHFTVYSDEEVALASDESGVPSIVHASGSGSAPYFSPIGSDFLSLLLEEDTNVPKSRRAQERSSAVVVTQSALNGLARYTGKYLLMMHLMSAASMDIFMGLKQLFEYYLCAVFNGFVPLEDRKNVLLPPARISPFAQPPMQAQDFDVRFF